MKQYPVRTSPRLSGYDYSNAGAYFVTLCTKRFANLFGDLLGNVNPHSVAASLAEQAWKETIRRFPGFSSPIFVVMPNHFHAIVIISEDQDAGQKRATLSQLMQYFKRYSTNEYIKAARAGILDPFEGQLWQRSFHDHIIRSPKEYQTIWSYIAENPMRWAEDRYYEQRNIVLDEQGHIKLRHSGTPDDR